jgi:hypothetical protein
MREFIYVRTLAAAKRRAPWAAKIAKVYGGYLAFACSADHAIWIKQK